MPATQRPVIRKRVELKKNLFKAGLSSRLAVSHSRLCHVSFFSLSHPLAFQLQHPGYNPSASAFSLPFSTTISDLTILEFIF
jgi:hypothetical protein